jgi:hypothetical protein
MNKLKYSHQGKHRVDFNLILEETMQIKNDKVFSNNMANHLLIKYNIVPSDNTLSVVVNSSCQTNNHKQLSDWIYVNLNKQYDKSSVFWEHKFIRLLRLTYPNIEIDDY